MFEALLQICFMTKLFLSSPELRFLVTHLYSLERNFFFKFALTVSFFKLNVTHFNKEYLFYCVFIKIGCVYKHTCIVSFIVSIIKHVLNWDHFNPK